LFLIIGVVLALNPRNNPLFYLILEDQFPLMVHETSKNAQKMPLSPPFPSPFPSPPVFVPRCFGIPIAHNPKIRGFTYFGLPPKPKRLKLSLQPNIDTP
jgi:hypothetical protein